MALKFERLDADGMHVLSLAGKLVSGEESLAFREEVQSLSALGRNNVVLVLAEVTDLDSGGADELFAALQSATRKGDSLKLAGIGSLLDRTTETALVFEVFKIFRDNLVPIHTLSYWARCANNHRYRAPGPCPECPKATTAMLADNRLQRR